MPTFAGIAYIHFIIGGLSRTIVGWRIASNVRTQTVLDAI